MKLIESGCYKGRPYWIAWNSHLFFYCGYVATPYKLKPAIVESEISVHGGVTYVEDFLECANYKTKGTVIGFDCGHYDDYSPVLPFCGGHRWTKPEVEEECRSMIDQLYELEGKGETE